MPESDADAVVKNNRPPLTLICGAAGTGKTEWAIRRYLEAVGQTLLIVASPAQAETLAAQIAGRGGVSLADARASVGPFRKFIADTYKSRPDDGYQLIGRAFQRIAVGEVIRDTIHRSDFLGRMLDAPGFATAFTDRLREWKLACITPEDLEAGCCLAQPLLDDPVFPQKTGEFARLFRAYENFLSEHRMRDGEDAIQMAIRHIDANALLDGDYRRVMVDGFFRFNRAQRQILAALANRRTANGDFAIETAVTLPLNPARPLLFAAPQRAREIFGSEFRVLEHHLTDCRAPRPPSLRLLEARLFQEGAGGRGSGVGNAGGAEVIQNPKSKIQNLQLFSAPNPYVEAEMIAREFRRIHDAGGFSWDDFGIILRTQGDYAPILSAVFERYAIPLGADGPEKLDQNPLMKTILHLLDIFCDGWQREDVLAFIKSSYTAPDKIAADALRRRARAARVRSGRGAWLALAEKLTDTPLAMAGETLRLIADCEDAGFPERGDSLQFAEGIRQAAKDIFGMTQRAETGETLRRERDRAAWAEADTVMAAVAQMAAMAGRESVPLPEFCGRLREAWGGASSLAMPEGEMARVMEPYESRERPLRVAAVMGMTERVFPRRINEDPFLRDAERAALRRAAGLDLEEERDRADDERLFFYLAVTAPSEALILSYPRSSDNSDTLPSFYLDEVRAAFASEGGDSADSPLRHVTRTLADVAPQAEEAVSDADRTLAACADLFDPASGTRDAAARQQRGADALRLRLQSGDSAAVRRLLESRCLPRLPRFDDFRLQTDFAANKTVYSVTELETHLRCPFQYLLRHVLRLRPDADDGAANQGDLLHGTLRRYFRRRQRETPDAPTPDAATMQAELREILSEALTKRPIDAPPHRARMMTRTVRDALDGFAQREAVFTPHLETRPAHFELAFGIATGRASVGDEEREIALDPDNGAKPTYDPASVAEPLTLTGANGDAKPVLLCGVIDRVDYDAGGIRAVIMDYKLGTPPNYEAIASGASLQMPLYLLAMERLFGKIGAAACYDSALETGRRRLFRMEHVNMRQFAPRPEDSREHVRPLNPPQFRDVLQAAEAAAIGAARGIEAGHIEARPGSHCAVCDYRDVCRANAEGGHDGETAGV